MANMSTEQMNSETPIGLVSSTIGFPANENRFSFIITNNDEGDKDAAILNQFDIVKVKRSATSKDSLDYVYAVVEQVQSLSDAPDHVANYISYNFGQSGIEDALMDRIRFYLVTAKVSYNKESNFFPVRTGDKVYLCNIDELDNVLYANYNSDDFFPIARHTMYKGSKNPIKLTAKINKNYLLGPLAAHLNISGMSGIAAKTTKAMTILRELYLHSGNETVSLVIFNTKGEDLLNLEQINSEGYQDLDEGTKKKWSNNICVLRPNSEGYQACSNPTSFVMDFSVQKKRMNLDVLVSADPDDSGTMALYIDRVSKIEEISSWSDLRKDTLSSRIQDKALSNSHGKFQRLVCGVIPEDVNNSIFYYLKDTETGQNRNMDHDLSNILKSKLDNETPNIIVIDLASLPNQNQQSYVFGCAIREIQRYSKEQVHGKVAVFIDELNKYASEDIPATSPILKTLIEIAETGRSDGVCLVTAEQSLSVINKRIKANIATNIYGKTGTVELTQADYLSIPPSFKERLSIFQNKDGLISSPTMNAGFLLAEFPDKFYADSSKKTDGGTNQKEESKAPKGKSTSKKKS